MKKTNSGNSFTSVLDSMIDDMDKLQTERNKAINALEKNRDILKAQLGDEGKTDGEKRTTDVSTRKSVEKSEKPSLRQKLSAYKQKIGQQRNSNKARTNQPEL